ncbi:MAG: ROK family protein, partial [Sphingobacterium sp.]
MYFTSPQSIAELSNAIGKSVPNITSTVNKLLENNLIEQKGLAPSTGGRRAAQFIPKTDNLPLILCVAIDQFYTSVVVVDFQNNFKSPVITKKINIKETTSFSKLTELIQEFLSQKEFKNIYGIGVTIPGFVDSNTGINDSYNNSSKFYDLKTNIEGIFKIPTFVENDSSAIAIAEHQFGLGEKSKNVMVVNLNWGVGLGMILDDELYRGHSGYAGEFSHIPLSNVNKLCSCGKKGCLEVEASLLAAVDIAQEKLQLGEDSFLREQFQKNKAITGDQLLEAANLGDQLALEAIHRIGYMLGKGIATLIHIINPEKIIISGRGAKAKNVLLPQVQSAIYEFSIQRLSQHTIIQFSTTENIQLLGSACITIANADKNIYKKVKT